MYDVVVVADQGHSEAWTMTTIIIGEKYFCSHYMHVYVVLYFHNFLSCMILICTMPNVIDHIPDPETFFEI